MIVNPEIEAYIHSLLPERDEVVAEMEAYAAEHNVPIIGPDKKHGKVKLSPFATWTEDMLWTYIHAYELPYNVLHNQGYPSIGCYPCTKAVDPNSQDKRAGRWANHAKTECGIHVNTLNTQEKLN